MADNEIKILKTNTFEEWRQKSNEVSLNVGADDRLDARLTDKVFKHDNVSGLKLNIIDGNDDDSKQQVFPLISDTHIDNTNGYIILKQGTTIPSSFVKGATVSQSGGYTAVIESVVTVDSKPKILVKNSSGDFNSGQNLAIGGQNIAAANLLRIISESYNKAGVRVLNGSTELVQGLLEANFHVPTVSGKITLAGSPSLTHFTEGVILYQGGSNSPDTVTTAHIEDNATWYATVYHAGTSHVYVKTHSGTYSNSVQVKVQGFATADAKLTSAQHTSFEVLDPSLGHVIEFNKSLTTNDDIKVISTDLVTAVNELQDDIGTVENLTTSATDLQSAINEHEADLFNAEGGNKRTLSDLKTADKTSILDSINEIYDDIHTTSSVTLGTDANYLVGGINELETAVRGNLSNYNLGTNAGNIVSAVNELETALRGNNTNYTVTAGDNIRDGLNAVYADIHTNGSVTLNTDANFLVGGINELETAARGTNSNYNLSTSAGNFKDAINELYADIHTAGSVTLNTDANYLVGAINEIETALRGTNSDYAVNTGNDNFRDAIRTNQTEIGAVTWTGTDTTLSTANPTNLTSALNALDAEIGDTDSYNDGTYGAVTIAGTLDLLQTGVINNDTDIGNLQKQIDGATTVDTARSWTGLAATHISGAIQELADTDIIAGAGLTGGGTLQADRTLRVAAANNGGITVLADSIKVDSTVVRTNTANQTVNTNLTFTSGNTLTIPSGATLDIDGALQIGGSGGGSLVYATSFITIAGDNPQTGLEIDRSEIDTATVSTTLDAKIQWNEGVVGTKPDRAWQWVGIDESGNALNADLVSFYNAKDLIADTTEIDHTWDASLQSFSSALKTTGVTAAQYGGTTAIPVITIDSKGRITAAETASIVTELTVEADSGTNQVINLANETLDLEGTSNQISTTTGTNKVVFSLPSTMIAPGTLRVDSGTNATNTTSGALRVDGGVGIAKDVYIGGNLTVSGTTTQVNSNQVNIGDNIIVLNADETSAPTQNAGFEVERGSASNVQLIWNEGTDAWQVEDASGNYYNIIHEGIDYDTWRLAAEGVGGYESITNAEQVTFNQAAGLTVTRSGSTIEYGHADTSTLNGQQGTGTGGKVIQDFTVDGFGHVTAVDEIDLDNRYIRSWTARDHDGTDYTVVQGDILQFKEGSGMDVNFTADDVLTFTNTDRGSAQKFFKDFAVTDTNSGYTWSETGTAAAEANEDTLTFVSGTMIDIDVDTSSDAILINHADTSSQASVNNSEGYAIQDITLDSRGHITVLNSSEVINKAKLVDVDQKNDDVNYQVPFFATDTGTYSKPYIDTDNTHFRYNPSTTLLSGINVDWSDIVNEPTFDNYNHWKIAAEGVSGSNNVTSGETVTFNVGDGLTVTRSGETIEYAHANTSDVSNLSSDNSSGTVIQDLSLTFDQFGHTTARSVSTVNLDNRYIRSFQVEDSDGTEVTINQANEWKFVEGTGDGASIDINWTDVSHGSDGDPYDLTFAVTNTDKGSAQPTINKLKVVSSDSGYSWSDTGTVTITGNKTEVDFVESTGIDIDIDNTNKALKFRNSLPNVTTNISCSVSGNTVNVNSSDGTDGTIAVATTSAAGVMSKEDKSKLNGIDTSADVNQNAYSIINAYRTSTSNLISSGNPYGSSTTYVPTSAQSVTDTISFYSGPGVDIRGGHNSGTPTQEIQWDLKDDQRDVIDQIGRTGAANMSLSLGSGYAYFYENSTTSKVRISAGGQIDADGDIVAFSSAVGSDIKLKDNVQVVDGALEKVSQLEGVTFEWKKDGRESAGVIAQNVEEVFPRAVKEVDSMGENEGETHKVVDYNQLSALFVEAIKELKEENKSLRAEIEALKDINR